MQRIKVDREDNLLTGKINPSLMDCFFPSSYSIAVSLEKTLFTTYPLVNKIHIQYGGVSIQSKP